MFQHEKREWAKTVLSVDETKPARLPIVDLAIRDIGGPRQKFKLEIGPVCYSWVSSDHQHCQSNNTATIQNVSLSKES